MCFNEHDLSNTTTFGLHFGILMEFFDIVFLEDTELVMVIAGSVLNKNMGLKFNSTCFEETLVNLEFPAKTDQKPHIRH